MQSRDSNNCARLKRICLIGDHHQLSPVIKNNAIATYGNLQQSLFSRLIRLSVPFVQLDMQARCRPSICDLYRWNYENLQDLPMRLPEFENIHNTGFKHDYQFVNVDNYEGQGETAPRPFFTQNLGEAEYVVSVYQYMILLG
jgi:intron-binding protein aquarius